MNNSFNYRMYIDWEEFGYQLRPQSEYSKELARKKLRGLSDRVYSYLFLKSYQNPEKETIYNNGEVVYDKYGNERQRYKEPYRYIYMGDFNKSACARELGISRPTLDKRLKALEDAGLVEIGVYSDKYQTELILLPHQKASTCLPARTVNFLLMLGNIESGRQNDGIIILLFTLLKAYYCRDLKFELADLRECLQLSNKPTNNLKILNYLILLEGLDLIAFKVTDKNCGGGVIKKAIELKGVQVDYNSKMETYERLLGTEEEVQNFLKTLR